MIGATAAAVALDMDGVLLKTNDAKFRAMLGLFAEYPAKTEAIARFILRHGGVPRSQKLLHILESIIGMPATEAVLAEYLAQYNARLEGVVSAAPLVPGIGEFLAACPCPLYLCSSAPADEVSRQLAARNFQAYFDEVFDSRTPKDVALRIIARRHAEAPVVFFGDSLGDLAAARAAQVSFVAVAAEWDNFPDHDGAKLRDFTDAAAIRRCISEATSALRLERAGRALRGSKGD